MIFTPSSITITLVLAVLARAAPLKRAVDPALVPEFGLEYNLNPTGTGDCDGINNKQGKPILIPCACPPERKFFLNKLEENILANRVVNNPTVKLTFPTDSSKASRLARLEAAAVTLQNLNGPGQGCPIVSTTFAAQKDLIQQEQQLPDEIDDGPIASSVVPAASSIAVPVASSVVAPVTSSVIAPAGSSVAAVPLPVETPAPGAECNIPAPAPISALPGGPASFVPSVVPSTSAAPITPSLSSPAPAPSTSAGVLSDAEITALAPKLGHASNINPDGTGNCDGAVKDKTGKFIQVPCTCPPTQEVYLQNLLANVKAGKAVNNPTVKISFPGGDSKEAQSARITAVLISLQNLFGPGIGCPASATTLGIQMAALNA